MLTRLVASALLATVSLSGMPAAQAQQASPRVIVPSGTVVPLTLVNPIKSKTTRPGDTVRASVAFPITVGDQVAIPAGTYVEGVLGQPLPKVKHQPDPGVQIHFTRLVFANGYSAPLDATQADLLPLLPPAPSAAQPISMALLGGFNSFYLFSFLDAVRPPSLPPLWSGWRNWVMAPQVTPTLPTLPPLPHNGPNTGVLVGVGVGVPAALIILGIIFHHKAGNSDFIVHDAGWQFQMKLAAPLSVDTGLIIPGLAGTAN